MKKQYIYYDFFYNIELYHNGRLDSTRKVRMLDIKDELNELELQGYSRAYTREEVNGVRRMYISSILFEADNVDDYYSNVETDIEAYLISHNIPICFYYYLFGELIKTFGEEILIPDMDYLAEYDDNGNKIGSSNDDYSYRDQIEYNLVCMSGTAGWAHAFKASCEHCNCMWLWEDYSKMDWIYSDIFDGHICDATVDILFQNKRK